MVREKCTGRLRKRVLVLHFRLFLETAHHFLSNFPVVPDPPTCAQYILLTWCLCTGDMFSFVRARSIPLLPLVRSLRLQAGSCSRFKLITTSYGKHNHFDFFVSAPVVLLTLSPTFSASISWSTSQANCPPGSVELMKSQLGKSLHQ